MFTIQMGICSEQVIRLQLLLNAQVFPSPRLRPDGTFEQTTHNAVVRFQQTKRLPPTGVVDERTWAALGVRTPTVPAALAPVASPGTAPWMTIARAEVGIHEDSLPGRHNPRILEYHATTSLRATTDEVAWCSSFVNWVMEQAGRVGTDSAAAASWLAWGHALTTPQPGAITVIYRPNPTAATGSTTGNHVGFFVEQSTSHIRLLGGNQSDQVQYSNFRLPAYRVKGYRWPS